MKENLSYMKTAMLCMLFALLFASFSQSCSVTKAGNPILYSPNSYKQPTIEVAKSLKFNSAVVVNDSPKKRPVKDTVIINKVILLTDTVNYNKLLLESQKAGNEMTSQILTLLLNKEKENKKLKVANKVLEKKSEITTEQKQDSLSMRAIWEVGNYILSLIGFGIILLMLWTYMLAHRFNKKVIMPQSSCSDGR